MTVKWSPHARRLLREIVIGIADALYPEDAIQWEQRLREAATGLANFPLSCPNVPLACFLEIPPNPERLRQLICKPYRIVYEVVGEECRILSIRHGRMLMTADDLHWN